MDFRFNSSKLFGDSDILVNDEETCAIEESDGLVGGEGTVIIHLTELRLNLFLIKSCFSGGVDAVGADTMWNHAPASCDSEVSRETKKGVDYIVVKKAFTYRGDNSAQTIGAASIYLDDASTVKVEGKN